MIIVTKRKRHKPLLNDDGEAYEFELKPVNGKHIRAFNLCCYCDVLFESGKGGQCPDGPMLEGHQF